MHSDVDQYETSTPGLTPESELLTVLPAEAARVAGEEVQPRKSSRVRSSTYVTYTSPYPKGTRGRRVWAAPPPQRVVFPRAEPGRRNPGSVLRSHAQRVSGLLKNDETRAEVKVKLSEMVVKSQRHGTGKGFTTTNKVVEWNQNGPDLPRPVESLKSPRRLAPGPPTKGATKRLVKSLFFGKGQARTDERHLPLREVMASKTKESGRSAL